MARLTAQQRNMYHEFTTQFHSCWACLVEPLPEIFYREVSHMTRKLDRAHIVGGSGRRHDRRAIVMLCRIHHGAQEGLKFRPTRDTPLPRKLTIGNMLFLKAKFDLEFYDVEYIQSLRIKHAEKLEPEGF